LVKGTGETARLGGWAVNWVLADGAKACPPPPPPPPLLPPPPPIAECLKELITVWIDCGRNPPPPPLAALPVLPKL